MVKKIIMKTFLLKEKVPIVKWGNIPDETYFEGNVPEGYSLAISPSNGFIIVDVDVDKEKSKNGFLNIPIDILEELEQTFNYSTKRGGKHYWFFYTGNIELMNKPSGFDIDLRVGQKGYVRYPHYQDIRLCLHKINNTSHQLNSWLIKLFGNGKIL